MKCRKILPVTTHATGPQYRGESAVLYPPRVNPWNRGWTAEIPDGFHGMVDGIHGMGDGIHGMGDGLHTFLRWIP